MLRTVAEGLNTPWGLTPPPGGGLLVSSRDEGAIVRVDEKSGRKTSWAGCRGSRRPARAASSASRCPRLRLRPHGVRVLHLGLRQPRRPDGVRRAEAGRRAVGRARHDLQGHPQGHIHNGGRIAFGPDNMLFVGTGESGNTGLSQDNNSVGGKILRLTPEGRARAGQPVPGLPRVPVRPPQCPGPGLGLQAASVRLGVRPGYRDELNTIKPGDDYGWPEAEGRSDDKKFHKPDRPVDNRRGLPQRHRLRRGFPLDGRAEGKAAVAHPAERHEGLRRSRRPS